MTSEQIAKIGLYNIATEGRLTEWAQEKTKQVAEMIAEKYPEIAAASPEMIGEMAKDIVKDLVSKVGNTEMPEI